MQSTNIRIKDIAKMAGVSEGTVDRVLHKRGNVSPAAAEKVNRVLAKIKYNPNLIARSLGKRKQYRITTLIPDPATDPFWQQSHEGIVEALEQLHQFGMSISVESFYYDITNHNSFTEQVLKNLTSKPDAVLIAPLFFHESISFFKKLHFKHIPFVLFNTQISEAHSLTFIGQDLFMSGRLAGQLASMSKHAGKTMIVLHIDEDLHNAIHLKEKESGFRDFLQKESSTTAVVSSTLSSHNPNKLKEDMGTLISKHNPAAVFISTSKGYKVAGIIKKLNPKIKVIGYDLISANIECLKAATIDFIINQNPTRQARLGIQILANHLLFNRSFQSQYLFPLEVITAENVASYLMHAAYASDITI